MKKADFLTRLSEDTPFDTEAQLESWIKRTEADVRKKQRRDLGLEEEPEEVPTFPLLERPDEELTEDEMKEKKRQRLMKGAWDARMKVKEEKRKEKERMVSYPLCSVIWGVADITASIGRGKKERGRGKRDEPRRLGGKVEGSARREVIFLPVATFNC